MSKSISNLIRINHVSQNEKIFMHVGEHAINREITFTDDKDCIPCDITKYRTAEFFNLQDLFEKIIKLEEIGYHVMITTGYLTYETGDTYIPLRITKR